MPSKLSLQVRSFHSAFGVLQRDTPGLPDEPTLRSRVAFIGEEFVELLRACGYYGTGVEREIEAALEFGQNNKPDFVDIQDALLDIDYFSEGFRAVCGVDGEPLMDEVQRSNMDKLGPDGKPIRRESDKKILKPDGWQPPRLRELLIAQGWHPTEDA